MASASPKRSSAVLLAWAALIAHCIASQRAAATTAAGNGRRLHATAASTSAAQAAAGTIGREQRPSYVDLDLFVMSRCPDALRCEARIDEVLKAVGNITQVHLNFIAETHGELVTCKHGDLECAGDAQQLCVQRNAAKQSQVWDFVRCVGANASLIGQEAWADQCLSSAVPSAKTREDTQSCYYGRDGMALLHSSAQYSHSLGVQTSCTIWLDNKPRCVQDGGIWYNCPGGPEVSDFIHSICNVYWEISGDWPAECKAQLGASGHL